MRQILLASLFLLFAIEPTLAWGIKGHQVIAQIAYYQLTDRARNEVNALLGGGVENFVAASTWADEVRPKRPQTSHWHYVNIPYNAPSYQSSRDCPKNDCVVGKISEFARVIGDRQIIAPLRTEALKFLIHFVGDLHQPLHAADDHDQGGNDVWVRLRGRTDRLHSLWDTRLVDALGSDYASIATSLTVGLSKQDRAAFMKGNVGEWANESHRIADTFIYARSRGKNSKDTPIVLPPSYVAEALPRVSERLLAGGLRLAELLNSSFSER